MLSDSGGSTQTRLQNVPRVHTGPGSTQTHPLDRIEPLRDRLEHRKAVLKRTEVVFLIGESRAFRVYYG